MPGTRLPHGFVLAVPLPGRLCLQIALQLPPFLWISAQMSFSGDTSASLHTLPESFSAKT